MIQIVQLYPQIILIRTKSKNNTVIETNCHNKDLLRLLESLLFLAGLLLLLRPPPLWTFLIDGRLAVQVSPGTKHYQLNNSEVVEGTETIMSTSRVKPLSAHAPVAGAPPPPAPAPESKHAVDNQLTTHRNIQELDDEKGETLYNLLLLTGLLLLGLLERDLPNLPPFPPLLIST